MLEDEAHQKEKLEEEIAVLKNQLLQLSIEADEGPVSVAEEIAEVNQLLQNEIHLRKAAEEEANNLKSQLVQLKKSEDYFSRRQKMVINLKYIGL
ncbi:kinesin-like protein KIN-UB [Magnolia sinica]|uniref:kinesin-like protein KIN-UB n=1 Tax=Magnolia sinica TaxID=86752 RepID=UPI0026598B59|nr:kinesin-like protein KIN-UB [Magnolia sinica]